MGTSLQKESFIPGLLKPTYGVLVIGFQCTLKNLFPKYAVEEVCVYIVSFIPDFSYDESLQWPLCFLTSVSLDSHGIPSVP